MSSPARRRRRWAGADFGAAADNRTDEIIIDIEDGVDETRKDAAREAAAEWLARGRSGWVRTNERASRFWEDDVAVLRDIPGLRGVVLAKTESTADVTETFDRLSGSTPVVPLVESALGIEECLTIARARSLPPRIRQRRLPPRHRDRRRRYGDGLPPPGSRLVVASRVANGHVLLCHCVEETST